TARRSRDALMDGDFAALGRAMIDITAAQRCLPPGPISPDNRQVIEISSDHGALGWKVNGAGGRGGSVTILRGPSWGHKRAMIREIESEFQLYKDIPVSICRDGLQVWNIG
ncbi:GHMP kinase, partial [Chloroflexota bacterium]